MILQILVYGFYIYLLLGIVFGLWFVFIGVNKVDENMKAASWRMKLLLLPGSIGLWIVLLRKVLKKS